MAHIPCCRVLIDLRQLGVKLYQRAQTRLKNGCIRAITMCFLCDALKDQINQSYQIRSRIEYHSGLKIPRIFSELGHRQHRNKPKKETESAALGKEKARTSAKPDK